MQAENRCLRIFICIDIAQCETENRQIPELFEKQTQPDTMGQILYWEVVCWSNQILMAVRWKDDTGSLPETSAGFSQKEIFPEGRLWTARGI